MTMVSTGPISLGGTATTGGLNQSVNVELGRSGTASINMNESAVRTLAGVPSGAISMNNFYGKANQFSFTISANQTNANLATLATTAGWNGSSKLVATIGTGVYLSSNTTGTPALTISGSFPGGVDLINNGFIVGMGGAGGDGRRIGGGNPTGLGGNNGGGGGLALSVSSAVTITNNQTIAGGGGGGGGGVATWNSVSGKGVTQASAGGGGGGGGRSSLTNSSGGAGGLANFGAGTPGNNGGAGTSSSAGGAGNGGTFNYPGMGFNRGGNGGGGGDWGASGTGGGFGTTPGSFTGGPFSGGGGGAAISGNSNITWVTFGTRLGAIT
jgi:hypothetical protein